MSTKQLAIAIPDWFDLDNYKDAINLTEFEWYLNLNVRKTWFFYTEVLSKLDGKIDGNDFFSNLGKDAFFSELPFEVVNKISDPIRINDVQNLLAEIVNEIIRNPLMRKTTTKESEGKTVDYATHDDIQAVEGCFGDLSCNQEFSTKIISVSLSASDERILEDFKSWLKEARRSQGIKIKKTFTDRDFSSWVEYKVLPYLDLKIWARQEKERIKQVSISRALFPDETIDAPDIDPVERLRKTTKTKAEWLMNDNVISAIYTQSNIRY